MKYADKPYLTLRISSAPLITLLLLLTVFALALSNCLSSHFTLLSFLFPSLTLPFPLLPRSLSIASHFCPLALFSACAAPLCYREPRKLLQPLAQLQRVQHRPGHQGGHHNAAVRRVLRPKERRCAHPVPVGGNQPGCGLAHPYVHPHRTGGEDGGTCDHWPQW